jgi:hypothetical protein
MNLLRPLFLLILLFGFATTLPTAVSSAQVEDQQPQMTAETRALFTPTVKEYGRPGFPRITVYVWGNADSGVWNVEKGTDLLEFITVVSRARMTDSSPDRRRVETFSLYRNQQPGDGDPFFETEVEGMFANRGSYPALQEDDILVLETRTRGRFTWRDIARVTGTVAALVNTYLLFDRLNE